MSYINLAIALFTGVSAIYFLSSPVRVVFGGAFYDSIRGLVVDAFMFAVLATLSIWNFNLAMSA